MKYIRFKKSKIVSVWWRQQNMIRVRVIHIEVVNSNGAVLSLNFLSINEICSGLDIPRLFKSTLKDFLWESRFIWFKKKSYLNPPIYQNLPCIKGKYRNDVFTQNGQRIGLFVYSESRLKTQILLKRERSFRLSVLLSFFQVLIELQVDAVWRKKERISLMMSVTMTHHFRISEKNFKMLQ